MSAASAQAHDSHMPGFAERWLSSANHKDIGTLYLCLAVFAGTVGGALSIIMRAQLQHPGGTIITSGQGWNTIITSHGLIMIFFTVMPALVRIRARAGGRRLPISGARAPRRSEWTVSSLPPMHTFAELPQVR